MSSTAESSEHPIPEAEVRHSDWSPWVILLIIPIVLPLIPAIYNHVKPELFGVPAFYWIQLAYVPMSAAVTGIVYLKTRKKVTTHG